MRPLQRALLGWYDRSRRALPWRASRDPQDATETTAQLFLGVRIQCAKCHNHPFER